MVPYAKPLPQRDDDDGRPAARARGACSPPQRPPRPRAFRCCTMCSRWDGACATGSSSHRRRAVRATLFAFPPPARLELTAQRSRRRRYAPLHTLAYPECAEHLPVVLVYSGRLTRHCPRLLHPCNPRHDDRARRCRRRRRGHGPAVRRDVQVGGELVARTHGRGGAPTCTQHVRSSSGTRGLSDNSPETNGDQR